MFSVDLSFLLHLNPWCYFGAFITLVAVYDLLQKKHAILRNFPVAGHLRWLFELLGPELRQYLYQGDLDEKPFNRVTRSYVYATSKGENNKIGFGTQRPYDDPGEKHFLNHLFPVPEDRMPKQFTALVIGPKRRHPYFCTARVGIADMSYGSISRPAVKAFRKGSKLAGIHMCTGEGGLSPYHLTEGGLTFAEIGPAKFGYRTENGDLDWDKVRKAAALPGVVAFHIKLAQGAKPGAGGILPKEKITEEIALIRGISMEQDCHSPNTWSEFHDIVSMCQFISKLQEETGKPVGIKLVVGDVWFIHLLALYMKLTGKGPDYVIIDGGEGGTGAAPPMLADHVGMPIANALPRVDNIFRLYGIRNDVVIISSGKAATPADVARHLAMGADLVHIARAFMFSIGCIQALKCHTNHCPTGIATNNPWLQRGLDWDSKGVRCYTYAEGLRTGVRTLMSVLGVTETWQLNRTMFTMITKPGVERRFSEVFEYPPMCGGPRNPVTIHNLEEYRKKWNVSQEIKIPTQEELEAKLAAYVLAEAGVKETPVDDVRDLVEEAKLLIDHIGIVSVPDPDYDGPRRARRRNEDA